MTKLDDDELDTIEAIARNEQTGRLTRHEVLELVSGYRMLNAQNRLSNNHHQPQGDTTT